MSPSIWDVRSPDGEIVARCTDQVYAAAVLHRMCTGSHVYWSNRLLYTKPAGSPDYDAILVALHIHKAHIAGLDEMEHAGTCKSEGGAA